MSNSPNHLPKVTSPTEPVTQSRQISLDLLRTISISGVVFIHASWLLGCTSPGSESLEYMCRIAVPNFIVIWAFFYEKGYSTRSHEQQKKYFWRRFKYLCSVFLIWSCIYFLISADWEAITPKSLVSKYFSGYGWSGQYFFIILFQLQILFPWLRSLCFRKRLRQSTLIAIFCLYLLWGYGYAWVPNVFQKMGDRPFIFWIPYVFLGIAISHLQNHPERTTRFQRLNRSFPWWFLSSILIIPIEFKILNHFNLGHSHYLTPAVLLASLFFVLPFLTQNIILTPLWSAGFIWVGSNTMTLFVANPLLIELWHQVFASKDLASCSVLDRIYRPLLSTTLVIISGLFLAKLIKHTPLKGIVN